jgi:hypothetical protein
MSGLADFRAGGCVEPAGAACGDGGENSRTFSRRDSAGLRAHVDLGAAGSRGASAAFEASKIFQNISKIFLDT